MAVRMKKGGLVFIASSACCRICYWGTIVASILFSLNALGASSYSLSGCKLTRPRKNPTCSSHPVFEQRAGNVRFIPYLKVRVTSSVQTYWKRLFGVAYFFSSEGKLIAQEEAFPVSRGTKHQAFPVYLQRDKPDFVFFKIPFDRDKDWYAVITVGDKEDRAVTTWPEGLNWRGLDFPGKEVLFSDKSRRKRDDIDPVEEFAFNTGLSSHPRITYMLRKPKGVKSYSDVKGVLALCLLANSVEDVKDRLQKAEMDDDLTGILSYAEKRHLAVVCWGAWRYWDPYANWDELDRGSARGIADASRENSSAWMRGMKSLSLKYQLPQSGYLLCGFSASAQFSIRLAMCRPHLFKAVYAHVPSSFPKPMPLSKNVLWCLTTGEKEVGYDRSIEFLEAAQVAGYSMIYKAIPGLGHRSHPQADRICEAFFDYVTGVSTNDLPKPFYGDVFRQIVVGEDEKKIRGGIYVPLPTMQIIDAWRSEIQEKREAP